jgi:hypothetical protein
MDGIKLTVRLPANSRVVRMWWARHDARYLVSAGLRSVCTFRYKVLLNITKRAIAATELLLVFPAALFMMALFVRNLQPLQYEPARTAQKIVDWYAVRPHIGLWGLLIALPLAVLLTGCRTLLRNWSREAQLRHATWQTLAAIRAHLATLLIAGATLTAGGILAIVALHVLTD